MQATTPRPSNGPTGVGSKCASHHANGPTGVEFGLRLDLTGTFTGSLWNYKSLYIINDSLTERLRCSPRKRVGKPA